MSRGVEASAPARRWSGAGPVPNGVESPKRLCKYNLEADCHQQIHQFEHLNESSHIYIPNLGCTPLNSLVCTDSLKHCIKKSVIEEVNLIAPHPLHPPDPILQKKDTYSGKDPLWLFSWFYTASKAVELLGAVARWAYSLGSSFYASFSSLLGKSDETAVDGPSNWGLTNGAHSVKVDCKSPDSSSHSLQPSCKPHVHSLATMSSSSSSKCKEPDDSWGEEWEEGQVQDNVKVIDDSPPLGSQV
jgi:hypothetical protein